MKIFIRYDANILSEKDLEPSKEYIIGRAPGCDIQLKPSFISRKHGRLYFDQDSWWYQDIREKAENKEPQKIIDNRALVLEQNIEIVPEAFLSEQHTTMLNLKDLQNLSFTTSKKMKIGFTAFGVALLLFIIPIYQKFFKTYDANEIFLKMRPQIVTLEWLSDPETIDTLKKTGPLSDDDFYANIPFCTGIIIKPHLILTSSSCFFQKHLLKKKDQFIIKTSDKKTLQPGRIVDFNTSENTLILEVPGIKAASSPHFKNIKPGEQVFGLSISENQETQSLQVHEGLTQKTSESIHYTIIGDTKTVREGFLLNNHSDVVGILEKSGTASTVNADHIAKLSEEKQKIVSLDLTSFIDSKHKNDFKEILSNEPALLSVTLELPAATSFIQKSINDHVHRVFKKINEKNLKISDSEWDRQANASTPFIIPFPSYKNSTIKELNNDFLVDEHFSAYLPAEITKYESFKNALLNLNKYQYEPTVIDSALNLTLSSAEDSTYFYEPIDDKKGPQLKTKLYLSPDSNFENIRTPHPQEMNQLVLGTKGLSLPELQNSFLKKYPDSPLTLKDLPSPDMVKLQDMKGRNWTKATWNLFDEFLIHEYCLPLPQGYTCLVESQKIDIPYLQPIMEMRVSQKLSEVMIHPTFWNISALKDYLERGHAKNLEALDDIALNELATGEIEIKLITLNLTFKIPAYLKTKMIRIIPALYKFNGTSNWIAVGFETLQGGGSIDEFLTCETDVQLKNMAPYSLSFEDFTKNQSTAFRPKSFWVPLLNQEAQVINYCEHSRGVDDGYDVDYRQYPIQVKGTDISESKRDGN